jgi:predicted DNA-binding transcriptional regulator AlpA
MNANDRLIRRPEVQQITGLKRYMIDMLEETGAFPKRIRVGHRVVFWSAAEVVAFVEDAKLRRATGTASNSATPPSGTGTGGAE